MDRDFKLSLVFLLLLVTVCTASFFMMLKQLGKILGG